jgi:hypothetical protein
MKATTRVTTYGAFLMVLLGSAFGQHIQTDFDHQANFSQYKTYSWQEIKPANSLWDSRIKNAVDARLSAKGWTQVDNGGDVAIVAIKMTTTQRTLQTYYDNFWLRWRLGMARIWRLRRQLRRLNHNRAGLQRGNTGCRHIRRKIETANLAG